MGLDADDRRRTILQRMRRSSAPLKGSDLAAEFAVSRQVIVQDIAVLRARGEAIVATPRGYVLESEATPHPLRAVLAVRHGPELTEAELFGLVRAGVRVLDVIVEHPLYGELRGLLDLTTPEDVEEWLAARETLGATLLSSLTGGVHLHTVEASDYRALLRARTVLQQLGISLD
jgi:transcriptional regulator of NAD metabolism